MQSTEFSKKEDNREFKSDYRYAYREKSPESESTLNQKTKKSITSQAECVATLINAKQQ